MCFQTFFKSIVRKGAETDSGLYVAGDVAVALGARIASQNLLKETRGACRTDEVYVLLCERGDCERA